MTSPSISLSARALRQLLTPVLPLAGRDDMLPVLTAVQLQTTGTTLTATATDRFRVGICRHELAEAADFSALVRVTDLKRILTIFKPTRWDDPSLTLTTDGEHITVAAAGGLDGMTAASMSFALMEGTYPTVRSLFVDSLDAEVTATEQGFNAAFLADFRHAIRNGEGLGIRYGANLSKPIVITAGDHFIGLLMPRKLVDAEVSSSTYAFWRGLLSTPAPASEAPAAKRTQKAAKAS